MARTDHLTYGEKFGDDYCGNKPWHYVSRSNRTTKSLKRIRSKRNRKRLIPQTAYRGYGWGDENIDMYLR